MDGMELYGQLNDKLRDLDEANDRMRESGYRKAETEKEYRIAKAKKILDLRAEGFPVTICQDVAMGCVEVANKRFDRDCAEVEYETDREAVWSIKTSLRILNDEIARQTAGR